MQSRITVNITSRINIVTLQMPFAFLRLHLTYLSLGTLHPKEEL